MPLRIHKREHLLAFFTFVLGILGNLPLKRILIPFSHRRKIVFMQMYFCEDLVWQILLWLQLRELQSGLLDDATFVISASVSDAFEVFAV